MQKIFLQGFMYLERFFIMFINPISTNFKARVPLSEYKGVILKLTKEEEAKIVNLMSEKSVLLLQLTTVEKKLNKHKTIMGSAGLYDIYGKIEGRIREIENTIKQIKINRKNQQIEEMKKINLMM